MMDYIRILVESDLSNAINAFYELNNRKISHEYAREYFEKFCKDNNCDRIETYRILAEVLKKRLEFSTISDKNKFKGLEQAILTKEEREKLHPKKYKKVIEDEGR